MVFLVGLVMVGYGWQFLKKPWLTMVNHNHVVLSHNSVFNITNNAVWNYWRGDERRQLVYFANFDSIKCGQPLKTTIQPWFFGWFGYGWLWLTIFWKKPWLTMVVSRFLIRCGFGNRQYMQFDRKNNWNDSIFEIQSKNNKKCCLFRRKIHVIQ